VSDGGVHDRAMHGGAVRDSAVHDDAPSGLLDVDHLYVKFFTRRGVVHAVRDVSFTVGKGETLGLVGESGSGKSVTAQALMGLIDLPGRITGGDVRWKGESLVTDADNTLRRVRGKEIAMIFQDPMTSLNPLFTVGYQISEVLRRHMGMRKRAAHERATELLDLVGIANPTDRVDQYPHEMSGGMRQRVLIAMALACEPELLIADEPTTALDVTIQAQILELIASLQQRLGLSVLLITHDLGVVAGLCDRVAVMYSGKIVELAPAEDLYHRPGHPYSAGLLRSTPRLDVVIPRLVSIEGSPPDLVNPPTGCAFAARCALAVEQCLDATPGLRIHSPSRRVACWRPFEAPFENIATGAVADGSHADAPVGSTS
jgi:oligopeptide/dipeptide ABC transporter ATP-binding protein